MAGEYTGAAYATILPTSQTNVVDNVLRLQQQRAIEARQQAIYAQRLAEQEEKQRTGLLKYVNSYTGGLIKKIDPKNPYATLIATGIHDVQRQVSKGIDDGSIDDATAVSTINDGLDKWNQLATNWQAGESKLQGDAARIAAMGRNPQEKKAIADAFLTYGRKKLFFNDDNTPNADKALAASADADYAQDFLVNHPDLLPTLGGQFGVNDYKTSPATTEDVMSGGKLLQATTAFRLVPGVQEAYRDDRGKLRVRYVGETPIVDQATGKPVMENGKPVMGIDDEQTAFLLQQKPYLVRDLNLAVYHANEDRAKNGQQPLTDEEAKTLKQVTLHRMLPPIEEPVTGTKDLTARENLRTAAAQARQLSAARIRQMYPSANLSGYDLWFKKRITSEAIGDASTAIAKAKEEIKRINNKIAAGPDDEAEKAKQQAIIDAGIQKLYSTYIDENPNAKPPAAEPPKLESKSLIQQGVDGLKNLFTPKKSATPAAQSASKKRTVVKGTDF